MNAKVRALRIQDEPIAKLEQRRTALIAERDQCDTEISNLRARRSDAVIDDRLDEADQFDAELTTQLCKRARIEDSLVRLGERIAEQRVERARQERAKHNDEMARRLDALAAMVATFEASATAIGALGAEIGRSVEAIHQLGAGYLSLEDAVLHRLRQSLHGLVSILIDFPLGREIPIHAATETGRAEFFKIYAPARIIEEARRIYLMDESKPPELAA